MFCPLLEWQRNLKILMAANSFAYVWKRSQERMGIGAIWIEQSRLPNLGAEMESDETKSLRCTTLKLCETNLLTNFLVVKLKSCNIRAENVERLCGTVGQKFYARFCKRRLRL